ncbi:MAG: NADH-quinone oxidoreductase subunit N [Microscillaceae bacterium]|jgi:NADH-quinone oxidoreductase subunit N|nr:NADH-quinone oxidoreductase subunit N [Microscillaceae bacterium]
MFSKNLVSELSNQLNQILDSLVWVYPELVLAGWFLGILLLDLVWRNLPYRILAGITGLGLGLTAVLVYRQFVDFQPLSGNLFLGMLQLSPAAIYFKFIFLLCIACTVLLAGRSRLFRRTKPPYAEFLALLLAMGLGLHLLAMSVNLLMIYLSLEVVSLSSYILAAFHFNQKASEGSIKYLLFGAFSSGVMLYGMSLLYGFCGTLQITDNQFVTGLAQADGMAVLVAGFLAMAGLLFKISALPFHLWTPDVYQASPTAVVAFFATAPKIAGVLVLWQFSQVLGKIDFWLGNVKVEWTDLLAVLAILTIIFGNFSALWQTQAKRMLAYSAIAHAGFLLIPLVAANELGRQSLFFYLTVYVLMNFGAFWLVELMSQVADYQIKSYEGWGNAYPILGLGFLVVMIALTGLPPTAGFTAKLLIFSALWEAYQSSQNQLLLVLWVVGLLNTVVALYYYLKIPFYLFLRPLPTPPNPILTVRKLDYAWLILLIFPLIFWFFKTDWLMAMLKMLV